MKRQIRQHVFETNSSSLHTLVISNKDMGRCHLHIKKDGYVHVNLVNYYGRDETDYTTQYEKLVYIVTWMYIYCGCDMEVLVDSYMWKDFIDKFCDYVNDDLHRTPKGLEEPKCLGVKIDKTINNGDFGGGAYDYLDHQSAPYGKYDDSNCVVSLYRTNEVMNFIFNKNLWLHTDSD